jgi:hypothetical protein
VKIIKRILTLFLALVFMISSTGVIIFHSFCVCSGTEQISLYVSPETCEEIHHKHHKHDCCGNEVLTCEENCHECSSHFNDCGCSNPDVKFIKLVNQITDEEVRYERAASAQMPILSGLTNNLFEPYKPGVDFSLKKHSGPPVPPKRSFDFLIEIHQIKIPSAA